MRFTVTFQAAEDRDYSYGLVFTPCPVWVQGTREILNLNPESPHYNLGGVKRLFAKERMELGESNEKRCVVVAHADGYGEEEDLAGLMKDLGSEGFSPNLLRLPAT